MRRLLTRRRWQYWSTILVVVCGLLSQAPMAAAAADAGDVVLLGLGSICHAGGAAQTDPKQNLPLGGTHAHGQCVFCCAGLLAVVLPDVSAWGHRPGFVLAPSAAALAVLWVPGVRQSYASRAPPAIG